MLIKFIKLGLITTVMKVPVTDTNRPRQNYNLPWQVDEVPFLSEGGVLGLLKWREVPRSSPSFVKFFEWHIQRLDNGTSAILLKLSSTGFPKSERTSIYNISNSKNINHPLQIQWATTRICPGLVGFPGCKIFSANPGKVLGKSGQVGHPICNIKLGQERNTYGVRDIYREIIINLPNLQKDNSQRLIM